MRKVLGIGAAILCSLVVLVTGCSYASASSAPPAGFNWYETPVQLPAGNKGTYGTEGTYVLFGVWPQDVVPEADVAGLALDENATTTIERGSFKYVKGSDGNYYVKCNEKRSNSSSTSSTYTKDGSEIGTGSRWFKVMPIKWRVFDEAYDVDGNSGTATGKLLVAENILTANVPYYESTSNHRNGTYANNYKHSQIRAYLNGIKYNAASESDEVKWFDKGFLQTAFTSDAIDKIIATKVDNSENSTTNYDTQNGTLDKASDYACDPTDDKIFLLSEYEVTKNSKSTEAYYDSGTGNSRIRVTTDFAKANNAYQSTINGYGGYWCLRSPEYDDSSNLAIFVGRNGGADSDGDVSDANCGVVPALSISF